MDSIIQDGKVYFLEFVKNLLDIVSQSIQTIDVIQLWFPLSATHCHLTTQVLHQVMLCLPPAFIYQEKVLLI